MKNYKAEIQKDNPDFEVKSIFPIEKTGRSFSRFAVLAVRKSDGKAIVAKVDYDDFCWNLESVTEHRTIIHAIADFAKRKKSYLKENDIAHKGKKDVMNVPSDEARMDA